jgi:hypothetical protein
MTGFGWVATLDPATLRARADSIQVVVRLCARAHNCVSLKGCSKRLADFCAQILRAYARCATTRFGILWTPRAHDVPRSGANDAVSVALWRIVLSGLLLKPSALALSIARSIALSVGMAALGALPASAQARYEPPRTPDGRPDLQGMWTNSSITLLERANASLPLVLDAEQVKRMQETRAQQGAADAAPTATQVAPPAGRDPGGYNAFWLDRGMKVGVVQGTARSSWITEPVSGKLPISAEGKTRIAAILAKRGEDGPEGMNPADRCLIGSRGSGGPPMLNNLYNNTYQIVQTATHVMIDVEMMHDARIIRLEQSHKPAALTQWLGDSVGRWDGDTLVVTTRSWNRWHGNYEPVFLSETATVIERFTRTGLDEITYRFEIEDPGFYTQPWKGEMVFTPANGPVYEFACHEGNYALQHILQGARVREKTKK